MAAVSNVSLNIDPGKNADSRKVTVGYRLTFEPAEVGLPYEVSIDLVGEDGPTDDEKPNGSAQSIYSFGFPIVHHKNVVGIANSTRVLHVDSNEVSKQVLDEDPGVTKKQLGAQELTVEHRDEIFARVSIAGKPAIARSVTVGGFF